MTKAQEYRIEQFRRMAEQELELMCKGEIKDWKVEEMYGGKISLSFALGHEGDENTMLYFARDRVHVFIGVKGGVTYPVDKKLKNGSYKFYTKRWEGYSLYQIVFDQR